MDLPAGELPESTGTKRGIFICQVCGYGYHEAEGDPNVHVPPGTRFGDLPDEWVCPVCGVGKADFCERDF